MLIFTLVVIMFLALFIVSKDIDEESDTNKYYEEQYVKKAERGNK